MKNIKRIIKEEVNLFLNKNIISLNEYLDKYHGIPLKKYFSLTDEEKETDLIYRYSYLLIFYFNKLHKQNIIDDKLFNYIKKNENDEEILINDIINGNLHKFYKGFLDYIYQQVENDTDMPAHQSFSSPQIIKNQWLIHFTDNAMSIAKNGFKYGTDDFDKLNYTEAGITDGKTEGYDFAYDINDYERYYKYRGKPKYGNDAVIFQASGVKVWHYGDEEYQVIFWGKDAKNIIPVEESYDGYWTVFSSKTSQPLVHLDSLEEVVKWAMNNKEQYRKHLTYLKGK